MTILLGAVLVHDGHFYLLDLWTINPLTEIRELLELRSHPEQRSAEVGKRAEARENRLSRSMSRNRKRRSEGAEDS